MDVKIKICGLTTKEALTAVAKLRVNFAGFSFVKDSPCNILPDAAAEITSDLPPYVQKVAVVFRPDKDLLEEIFATFKPHYLQFDDDISPSDLSRIRDIYHTRVIKSICIKTRQDAEDSIKTYGNTADMLLFDGSDTSNLHGHQTDRTFDWSLLKNLKCPNPWILSGGLSRFNAQHAIRTSHAHIINASDTLEEVPGLKSVHMIEDFVKTARIPSYL